LRKVQLSLWIRQPFIFAMARELLIYAQLAGYRSCCRLVKKYVTNL
jgi:hypothetical protein